MSSPRIGSLFSGYGGLDMGVMAALGGSVAWHVEFDKAPSKILAHHWPDVPNYGDVTAVDWSQVEPVDIITGGSPCQDLSHAGKRQGMTEGTRSNLWVAMREAIAQLRPGLVVWENVRGAASAEATSDLEFCPGCMGGAGDRGTVLRALGRVVGDLADLGYVGRAWGLRAADVGAPHGRFRYFLAAFPADQRHEWAGASRYGRAGSADGGKRSLLPTPTSSDYKGATATRKQLGNDRGQLDAVVEGHAARSVTGWGVYADAIARWESLTSPAPAPTQPNKKGTPQLSPAFSEWLMGLPKGHVTGVPGLSRNDQLKALGNGVVPQQAEAALRFLLGVTASAAVA